MKEGRRSILNTSPNRVIALSVFLFILILLATSETVTAEVASQNNLAGHRLQVSDESLARQIEADGGRLLADYGTSKLYQTPRLNPSVLNQPRTELRDNYNFIRLNAEKLDTRTPGTQSQRQARGAFSGRRLHLVQFVGPVKTQWRNELLATGVQIIDYIPENTYLVFGNAAALVKVQKLAKTATYIQWDGNFQDRMKIHPLAVAPLAPEEGGTRLYQIQLVADEEVNAVTLGLIRKLQAEPQKHQSKALHFVNLVVRLRPADLSQIVARPDVVSVMPHGTVHKLCERQDQIIAGHLTNGLPTGPGYLGWLSGLGFTQAQFDASGIIVDVADSGIDNGTTSPAHFGLYVGGSVSNTSRVVYNHYESLIAPTGSNSMEGCDGHGTINAHIIAGYDDYSGFPFADTNGFHYGLGVCPFVRIGSSVILDAANNYNAYFTDWTGLVSDAYDGGARITSNSYGEDGSHDGTYDFVAQEFDALVRDAEPGFSAHPVDGNQQMVIVFAAGNDGSAPGTINCPATAKNVITVGAAESVQFFGGADHNGVSDSMANNANDVTGFSSRGPCNDGRAKPDIMAPGTHISGGVFQATNDFINFADGIADTCYSGSGVSGGPSNNIFWPPGQEFYTASSGTSQAAPCVAGGCALVMQYFLNTWSNIPSPAMTKAYLMNSARYLNSDSDDDALPSPEQGMGEMNLGTAFDGTPRILRDQIPGDLFTESGQLRSVTGTVNSTNKPFRVTLAWTDAPGSTTGSAYKNNLDLVVRVGTNTYKGNVFNGRYSVTGGVADAENNVESVFLPAGTSGNIVITVNATSINSVGVPNSNSIICQDFALVVYNANATTNPVASSSGSTVVSENCYPTNGVVDPGETVTVQFGVENIGTSDFTNLVATLQTNSGILPLSGSQSAGTLAAAGGETNLAFTFTGMGTCGGNITAVLSLQSGTNFVGTLSYVMRLGQFITAQTFAENFDGSAGSFVPLGWSNSTGNATNWVVSTNEWDSPSNAVFVTQSSQVGLSTLISPQIPILSASAQLSFMNNFDLKASPTNSATPTNGYDGGLLEIQTDSGPFTDIVSAGGSFASGGYTARINAACDNPLAGKFCWTGNSGGFISTVINLPASVAGHNIRLRWRCGTSSTNAIGGTGWYVDSVAIADGYYSCCVPLVTPSISNMHVDGTNCVFQFLSAPGQSYQIQYEDDASSAAWSTIQSVTGSGSNIFITNDLSVPYRFFRVISP